MNVVKKDMQRVGGWCDRMLGIGGDGGSDPLWPLLY